MHACMRACRERQQRHCEKANRRIETLCTCSRHKTCRNTRKQEDQNTTGDKQSKVCFYEAILQKSMLVSSCSIRRQRKQASAYTPQLNSSIFTSFVGSCCNNSKHKFKLNSRQTHKKSVHPKGIVRSSSTRLATPPPRDTDG